MRQTRLALASLVLGILFGASGSGVIAQTVKENALDFVRRGNQEYAKANYKLAIEEYSRVSANAGETYAQALYNIGVCHYELWKTEEAIVYYRRAVAASNAGYPVAWHALGVALKDLGRLPEAKKAFEKSTRASAHASDSNCAPAHFMLGLIAMGEGNHEAAAGSFRRAIAGFKDRFPAGHNNLGVALARMGRLPEAKREFEIALIQADGDLSEATNNLELCSSLLALPPKSVAALELLQAPRVKRINK